MSIETEPIDTVAHSGLMFSGDEVVRVSGNPSEKSGAPSPPGPFFLIVQVGVLIVFGRVRCACACEILHGYFRRFESHACAHGCPIIAL